MKTGTACKPGQMCFPDRRMCETFAAKVKYKPFSGVRKGIQSAVPSLVAVKRYAAFASYLQNHGILPEALLQQGLKASCLPPPSAS